MKAWAGSLYGGSHWSRILKNTNYYFRPGLTWPLRGAVFSAQAVPEGCIFSVAGKMAFVPEDHLLMYLGLFNSKLFTLLLRMMSDAVRIQFEVGLIQNFPIPAIGDEKGSCLGTLANCAWLLKRKIDTVVQTSNAFILPALLQVRGATLAERGQAWTKLVASIKQELEQIHSEIDNLAFDLYGTSEKDRLVLSNSNSISETVTDDDSDDDEDDSSNAADLSSLTSEILDYTLSGAFSHFDVRLATGDCPQPTEPEPFDLLPVCSPGMLVSDSGLPPISPSELPPAYPIQIPFNGILVDDEGHPSDIISHVRDVFKIIWGEKDSDVEQEACEILKVNTLRDYFRKPAAFFNDHLSRYSKSHRQAPIYLPLSTRSGSYTLWLYYHRLTDQTLYTCINDYVEPKLSRVSETVNSLRSKTGRSRDEEKTLEDLQTLEAELEELRDELLRVARFPWKPNLNDGVQTTVAPLHSLFRLGKWQKKLKETWDKLEKGDYDWAHLAYSIWTERVQKKCRKDKSLAIAHSLEDLYEEPPANPKRTGKRRKQAEA